MPPISTSGCSAKAICSATCQRLVNQDRNHFAACMVALGDADAMVTGVTRNFSVALEDVRRCIDPKPGHRVMGVSLVLSRGRTVLVADTAVTEMPNAEELADIAVEAAGVARRLGYEPRLALLAFSTFGHPPGERSAHVHEAVQDPRPAPRRFRIRRRHGGRRGAQSGAAAAYPFCRLSGPANVLIMPAFHSASISTKMLQELGGATVIGPLLVGLDRPVQIVPLAAKDTAARQHGRARGVQCERLKSKHAGEPVMARLKLRALLRAALGALTLVGLCTGLARRRRIIRHARCGWWSHSRPAGRPTPWRG